MDTISGIFAPVLGVMSGAGMLKALLILCTTFGWLKADMGTYRILYAAADGVFTFIPVFLAYTAAKKNSERMSSWQWELQRHYSIRI